MCNEYKSKLSEKPNNKWGQYGINIPLSLANDLANRVPSYGYDTIIYFYIVVEI